MNMGAEGMLRCIEVLDRHGIAHAGGGLDSAAARRPAVLDRNGTRIAFLAYTSIFWPPLAATDERPGMATVRVFTSYEAEARVIEMPGLAPIIRTHADPGDKALMQEDVRRARAEADMVVVSWHWGVSGAIVDHQLELAHAAVEAGADVVAGHHPHRLQGIEVYHDRPVFYSLGNFAFEIPEDLNWPPRQTTAVALVAIEGRRVVRAGFVPYFINEHAQPLPASLEDAGQVQNEIARQSTEFGTKFYPQDGESLVLGARAAVPAV